jgi:hypothetical protein
MSRFLIFHLFFILLTNFHNIFIRCSISHHPKNSADSLHSFNFIHGNCPQVNFEPGNSQADKEIPLQHLKTDHFFMQNNGHSVNLDFPNENEFGDGYFFPGYGLLDQVYRLSNLHFHWGRNDSVEN